MIRHARVADRATSPPCQLVSYWYVKEHHRAHPPEPTPWRRYKSPLAHLLERRPEAECEELLDEALQRLRVRRGKGRPAAAPVKARS
jgi:hypothetical protein